MYSDFKAVSPGQGMARNSDKKGAASLAQDRPLKSRNSLHCCY